MSPSIDIAVVGDVHLHWDDADVRWFDAQRYQLILFVGDLAGYTHVRSLPVAHSIARLETPALVMLGNHDGVTAPQLLAEVLRNQRAAQLTGRGMQRRCARLRRALEPVPCVGYSAHPLEDQDVCVVAARPHSMGGSYLAFASHMAEAWRVRSIEESNQRLCQVVDTVEQQRVVFFAHNGPSGLGATRSDIWGCDFRKAQGDFGDDDLSAAIDHARSRGKQVLAVVAGHMHHALSGGGRRTWRVERDGTLYVNAARVPRIFQRDGRRLRHHVRLTIAQDGASAEEVLVEA